MEKVAKKGLVNSSRRSGNAERRASTGSAIIGIGAKDKKNMYTSAAVAISSGENWRNPYDIKYEEERLQGGESIPFMDLLIAGLDGSSTSDIFGIMGKISNPTAIALDTVIFVENDDRDFVFNKTHEIIVAPKIEGVDSDEDIFVCGETGNTNYKNYLSKMKEDIERAMIYYRLSYPHLFPGRSILVASSALIEQSAVERETKSESDQSHSAEIPKISFHGVAPLSTAKKTKIPGKPNNSKKKPGDYKTRFRGSIRTTHINKAVAEVEMQHINQVVAQEEKQRSGEIITM